MAANDRIELRIPAHLKVWITEFARRRNTTVTALVIRFFTRLMEEEAKKSNDAEQV